MAQHQPATGPRPKIDTTVPHPARRYDYWLGGKDNFAADRESGDAVAAAWPAIRTAVIENRAFLRRAVTFLAGEAGIRQFLDIGTGIPTPPNVHEVAQGLAPAARVVYVDNDPLVLAHARALMTGTPQGATRGPRRWMSAATAPSPGSCLKSGISPRGSGRTHEL